MSYYLKCELYDTPRGGAFIKHNNTRMEAVFDYV